LFQHPEALVYVDRPTQAIQRSVNGGVVETAELEPAKLHPDLAW
jgi:hypothetical protein